MLNPGGPRRFFVAREPQDMRRGMDALASVVINEVGRDPYAGDYYIFISRNRKRLKVLYYEDGGFWLGMKRLDRGTFAKLSADQVDGQGALVVSRMELQALLEGLDVRVVRRRRREKRLVDNNGGIKYVHASGCGQSVPRRGDQGTGEPGSCRGLQAAAHGNSSPG